MARRGGAERGKQGAELGFGFGQFLLQPGLAEAEAAKAKLQAALSRLESVG